MVPAAIVTLAGTVATSAYGLESLTTIPPGGAWPLRVTVPVDSLPADTLVGFRIKDEKFTGGTTLSRADLVASSRAAKISTELHPLVDTVKVALVAPAGTVTLAGTVATAGLLLERVTVDATDWCCRNEVHRSSREVPSTTWVGFRLTEERGECWNRPVGLQCRRRRCF